MKKYLILFICIILVLAMASCGKNNDTLKNLPTADSEQVNSTNEESAAQEDANDALDSELYSQIKSLMDAKSMHCNAYYKIGDADKTPLIWDGGCLGAQINEEVVHLYTSEAIKDFGVCFELSKNSYESSNDLTITCKLTDTLGKVYVKVSGTINLYSEIKNSVIENIFNDVEFIIDDMATYLNLTALAENDNVESKDFDRDGLIESYANYTINNRWMLKIYDFVKGELCITAPEKLLDSVTGSSACSDCANIKPIYSKCIFVYSDNKEISGVYSYSDGVLTKECEDDVNQYCGM